MKKRVFYAAALAAILASCSSDNLSLPQVAQDSEAPGIEGAVNFSAYTGRSVTRAGAPGTLVTSGATDGQVDLETLGFGVFGYYTDQQDYDLQISKPNFMYNEQVTKVGGNWTYEPVKYWPNEYGSDAESQDIDKVSFFAYAPYVDVNPTTGKVTEQADYGITAVSRNTNTGDPIVWYKGSFDPAQSVDLCWGTVAPDAQDWPIIQDNGVQRMDVGLPWLNVQRPKGVTAADQKLKFQFKHALAQLNIQIDADPDLTEHNDEAVLANGTKVYVRSITLGGIASKGSLNLNNIVADEPLWQSYYGSGSIYAETATITDGRRDGKEGVSGATATNETLTGLNPVIISDDGNTTAGVTNQLVNLFNSTTATAPIYVIPTGEPITVSIVYDVETADDNLASVLSDGTTRGSSIENKITKEVVFGSEEFLSAGHLYTLKLHLGLNSVKFDAAVSDWQDDTMEGNSWLPNNVAKGVTLNRTRVAIAAPETLTATVAPDDVTNKEIQWTSSNTSLATVANGVVTPVAGQFGEVTISAYNPGTGKTAECIVLVTQSASTAVTTDEQKDLWFGKVIGTDGLLYATSAQATSYGSTAVALLTASKLGFALSNYANNVDYDTAFGYNNDDYSNRYGSVTGGTWSLPTIAQMQAMFSGYGDNGATTVLTAPDPSFTATGYHKKYDGTSGSGTGADLTTLDCCPADNSDGATLLTWNNTTKTQTNMVVPFGNLRTVPAGSSYNAPSYGYWLQGELGTDGAWIYNFNFSFFWSKVKTSSSNVRPVLTFN